MPIAASTLSPSYWFAVLREPVPKREFTSFWKWLFLVLAATYSLGLLYGVLNTTMPSSLLRGAFLFAISAMIFLRYPATVLSPRHRPSIVDILFIVAAAIAFGNFVIDYNQMAWRAGSANQRDVILGTIALFIVLESCRRAMGFMLPLIAAVLVAYAYLGPYIPGDLFGHSGFQYNQVIGDIYASMNGIFGFVAYVFIAYVMLFVLLGALLERFGAGEFFIGLPIALLARYRGGPAKAAVVSSCLFGMISGSATANTVATGAFTIPMMKRAGYRPATAGAIEAASSTGGMFMPPVMGAGAFLMAEMMGVPYLDIVVVALVPAFLYFAVILAMVHFEALRGGIEPLPESERESARAIFLRGWYYLIPIGLLFAALFNGYTASMAAFWAIISFIGVMFVKYALRGDFKGFFKTLFAALADGGEKSLMVGSTAGVVGIIIGMVLLTGVAFKFSVLMLAYTYDQVWLALIIVLIGTLVLGMGMTVTADYLILAVLAVPSLGELGVPLMAAHLAVFWFSQSSNVTPPVCMAAFAGASIAGASPYRTGFTAMRFSAYLYLMPFMFVYTPILMPEGFNGDVLYTWVVMFAAVIPFSAGITGHFFGTLNTFQRIALMLVAVILIFPVAFIDLAALALFLAVAVPQYLKWQDERRSPAQRA